MSEDLTSYGITVADDGAYHVSELLGGLRFLNGRLQQQYRVLTYYREESAAWHLNQKKPAMSTEWRDVPSVSEC